MPKFIVTRYYDAHETFEIEAHDADEACEIAQWEDHPGRALSAVTPDNLCAVVVENRAGKQLASWED